MNAAIADYIPDAKWTPRTPEGQRIDAGGRVIPAIQFNYFLGFAEAALDYEQDWRFWAFLASTGYTKDDWDASLSNLVNNII